MTTTASVKLSRRQRSLSVRSAEVARAQVDHVAWTEGRAPDHQAGAR
ncbi:MAG TPA: hypothetical protein VIO37_09160 [Candidatus Dormibacteraeota bacterium]